MRTVLVTLFVLIPLSLAVAGPFPKDDETPQPTMPPLVSPLSWIGDSFDPLLVIPHAGVSFLP